MRGGEAGPDVAARGDVVEAGDGDVGADIAPGIPHRRHHADRDDVADAEDDRARGHLIVQERLGGGVPGVAGEAAANDAADAPAVGGEAVREPRDAVVGGLDALARADDDGLAVAEFAQTCPERAGPAAVVDGDRADAVGRGSEHDDPTAHALERLELGVEPRGVGAGRSGGGQDQAPRALTAQRTDERDLARRVALSDGDRDDQARLVGAACDAGGELAEVGVGDVRDEQGHDGGGAARRRLRGEVRCVAEALSGRLHLLAVALGDLARGAVQHSGGRRQRHPCLAGHVVQGGRAAGGRGCSGHVQDSRGSLARNQAGTTAGRCGVTAAVKPSEVRRTASAGSVAHTSALKISTSMSPVYPASTTARVIGPKSMTPSPG